MDRAVMERMSLLLEGMSRPFRWSFVGAVLAFSAGAVAGLVLGLHHPPTVWFAVLELGLSAGIIGALFGLAALGAVTATSHVATSIGGRHTDYRRQSP